jgi:hypothetical protein
MVSTRRTQAVERNTNINMSRNNGDNIPDEMPIPSDDNKHNVLKWILKHRIGLMEGNQRNKIIQEAGIEVVEDILIFDEETVLSYVDESFTGRSKMRLKALRRFAIQEYDNYKKVDTAIFTDKIDTGSV